MMIQNIWCSPYNDHDVSFLIQTWPATEDCDTWLSCVLQGTTLPIVDLLYKSYQGHSLQLASAFFSLTPNYVDNFSRDNWPVGSGHSANSSFRGFLTPSLTTSTPSYHFEKLMRRINSSCTILWDYIMSLRITEQNVCESQVKVS